MNGNSLFLDTNIVLYLLSGDKTITDFLDKKTIYISFITELEVLGFKELTKEQEQKIREFLAETTIIDINSEIKKLVIELRKKYRIKLPDLIIASTAAYLNLPLMTSDKQLNQIIEINILQYEK